MERHKEAGSFYCLDWQKEKLTLQGSMTLDKNYLAVQVMAVPCGTYFTDAYGVEHVPPDDCVLDQEENMKVLGTAIRLVVLSNQGFFKHSALDQTV